MPLEIRQALHADLELLRNISIKSYYDTFSPSNTKEDMDLYLTEAFSEETIRKELEDQLGACWIAFVDNKAAGYARMRINPEVFELLGERAIEIHRMYALEAFIGKGIGSALMSHCLDYARKSDFDWVWLGVWERNFKAQRFYEKWGFEKFSEHPFLMGTDPQVDWLLKKRVGPDSSIRTVQ